MSGPAAPANGFTLVEVLVALLIASLALGGVLHSLGGGLHAARRVEDQGATLAVARSLLARAGADLPLADGRQEGTTADGRHWTLTVRPFVAADPPSGPVAWALVEPSLVEVVATVGGPGAGGRMEGALSLTTLRRRPRDRRSDACCFP